VAGGAVHRADRQAAEIADALHDLNVDARPAAGERPEGIAALEHEVDHRACSGRRW
jgi:hypothetical protein